MAFAAGPTGRSTGVTRHPLVGCHKEGTTQYGYQWSRRYGKTSLIITSNKSYGDWGDIFADQVLASAILDRLLHHSTTINIRGQSYRLREKRQAGVFHDLTAPPKEG